MSAPLPIPLAFYTPLKHPAAREPSGDREIARALMHALAACGCAPELASRLSTWRRQLDAGEALWLERLAAIAATRLVRVYRRRPPARRPQLWVTYQNYHRSPDLLGPAVATALAIPYVLVDTSVSQKPRPTAFRPWLSAARVALRRADLVFAMNPRDLPALRALGGAERLRLLPLPVDPGRFRVTAVERAAAQARLAPEGARLQTPLILCVAMMRVADKLDSYRLLGEALVLLHDGAPGRPWRLVVAGDGPARPAVEAAFAALPPGRVRLLGALEPGALPSVYAAADCFAFPGLGEAFGLVYLEAAAAGLPVVACHGPGPDATVPDGGGLLVERAPAAFAAALAALIDDPARRARLGAAGQAFVATHHSLDATTRRLAEGLRLLGVEAIRPA